MKFLLFLNNIDTFSTSAIQYLCIRLQFMINVQNIHWPVRFWRRSTLSILLLMMAFPVFSQNFVTPVVSAYLPSEIEETSGLMNLNGEIWTHNDSGGEPALYLINPSSGEIERTVEIQDADNEDWEDIAWDETYIYIGDFGNNDGSRTDLKIYRVLRSDMDDSDEVDAETIHFYYGDQTSFEPNYHNTNFDCEAMTCFGNQLYLFTKNWIDSETNCYVLPKTIGEHEATQISNFNSDCLITGASVMPEQDVLVLIGYNQNGGSFTWLFKNFVEDDFFNGSSNQLIWTLLSQIEGVCHADDQSIYISSEEFAGILEPTLYSLELSDFITGSEDYRKEDNLISYQHPNIVFRTDPKSPVSGEIVISDLSGKAVKRLQLTNQSIVSVPMPGHHGIFLVVLRTSDQIITEKIFIR